MIKVHVFVSYGVMALQGCVLLLLTGCAFLGITETTSLDQENLNGSNVRLDQPTEAEAKQRSKTASEASSPEINSTISVKPIDSIPDLLASENSPSSRSFLGRKNGFESQIVSIQQTIDFERIMPEELDENVGRSPGPFRVRIGDRLRVLVWGEPELGHVTDVYPNGSISLPLVGELFVEGMTLSEIKKLIENNLTGFEKYRSNSLKTGDQLQISVWGYSELATTAVIQPSGVIFAPLVGAVDVKDREIEDIRLEINNRLEQYILDPVVSIQPVALGRRILIDPAVSVLPEEVRTRKVAIIGEVAVPGLYPIDNSLSVIDLLATARYLRSGAMNSVIVIRDHASRKPKYKKLLIKDFLAGKTESNQNIYLDDNDIVIVPKRGITKVANFIDDFIVSTLPVFNYWSAAYSAASARDVHQIIQRTNRVDRNAERKVVVDERQSSFGSLLETNLQNSLERTQ